MINPTELMQSILTSEEAQIIIDHMSPIYGEARVFLWLLQAIGLALDEAESCKDDFDAQSLVAKATWSLKYYEDQYGLLTNTSLTDEQRRGNIFAAMRSKAPLNPAKLESILSAMGSTDVTVEENTGQNRFSVISGISDNWDSMVRFIESAKPAHTLFDFTVDPRYTQEATVLLGTAADVDTEFVASTEGVNRFYITIPNSVIDPPEGADAVISGMEVIFDGELSTGSTIEPFRVWNRYIPKDATLTDLVVGELPDNWPDVELSVELINYQKVKWTIKTTESVTIPESSIPVTAYYE